LPNHLPTRSALPLAAHEKFVENIIHSIVRIVYSIHIVTLSYNCCFCLQAIMKGFFAEFPPPVKEAAESIVNARWVSVLK